MPPFQSEINQKEEKLRRILILMKKVEISHIIVRNL